MGGGAACRYRDLIKNSSYGCHFHDMIPRSSIREVCEDSRTEYAQAGQTALAAWRVSAASITADGGSVKGYTVFNSSSWVRSDTVRIPASGDAEADGRWTDDLGRELASQKSGDHWLVQVVNVPGMGYSTIFFEETSLLRRNANPFQVLLYGIETPFYKIRWNDHGHLTSVHDKRTGREVLAEGQTGNVLQAFEDKQLLHDACDIDLFYQEKMRMVADLRSVRVTEAGAIRAVVAFEWRYMNSWIRQNLIVYRNSRRIDFETKVGWHERQQLLKVAFPVDIRAAEATYDIQFGNLKRPTRLNTGRDMAKFEPAGRHWADLSEYGYGVSLLNDCKCGYDINGNSMRLSLIKSAIRPDTEQDQGEHEFTYCLYPHTGGWLEGKTVQAAWELNNPLTYAEGISSIKRFSLFELSGGHVMIDCVKNAENDNKIVLRLHEYAGGKETVTLHCALPIRSWQESDLLERPIGDKRTERIMDFQLKPFEIKTFLIEV